MSEDQSRPDRPDGTAPGDSSNDRGSLRWIGYGVEFIGVLGIFTYGGYLADQRLGTRPWLMLVGLLLAFTGMFYLLLKETARWRK